METSNFRPELHVAQQSRRDKLRVQSHSNPNHNVEVYTSHLDQQFSGHEGNLNTDLVQLRSFRYGNLSYEPVVFPPEMLNFGATNSQHLFAHNNNNKDVIMLQQQESSNSSVKVSGDPQNCSNWKSIGSQENCDWIITNFTSGSAGGIDSNPNPNPIFVGQGLSASSFKSNNNHHPSSSSTLYIKPTPNSYGYHHEVRSPLTSPPPGEISSRNGHKHYGDHVNYSSPSLYHNNPMMTQTQELGLTAIPQHNNRETSSVSWANGGNELVLLPAYADQSASLHTNNACDHAISSQVDDQCRRWNGELDHSECKNNNADRDHHPRPTANDGSNTQALSLSLSSVPLSKSHGCDRMVPEDLHSAGCFSNLNQDTKILKSDYFCFDGKSLYNGRGLESDHHDMVGNLTFAPSRGVGPLGPFTGYATILKSSKFLKPSQQLLDEFCNIVSPKSMKMLGPPEKILNEIRASSDDVNATESIVGALGGDSGGSSSTFYSSNEKTQEVGGLSSPTESYRPEYLQKKAKLLYMLEEVCRRYKNYHQQMQMVVSAFESVAGLSAATPYISQALKSVSRHFRCLKNAISNQLKNVRKSLGEDFSSPTTGTSSSNKGDTSTTSRLKLMDQTIQKQKAVGGGGSGGFFEPQQHVWRPQRGLPERAVAILRAWLFDHFLHPYPTDSDKHMLATQTGLSRNQVQYISSCKGLIQKEMESHRFFLLDRNRSNLIFVALYNEVVLCKNDQVSNWFINARVRVWKPMVEEIHTLETKGSAETGSKSDGKTATESAGPSSDNNNFQPLNRLSTGRLSEKQVECSEIGSSSEFIRNRMNIDTWNQKRSRVECHVPGNMDGSLVGFVPYQQSGIEIGSLGAVSLTLGLRQTADGVQPQQQQQHDNQIRRHYGDQIIYDFVG